MVWKTKDEMDESRRIDRMFGAVIKAVKEAYPQLDPAMAVTRPKNKRQIFIIPGVLESDTGKKLSEKIACTMG